MTWCYGDCRKRGALYQIADPGKVEIVVAPTLLFMRQKIPFCRQCAVGARSAAACLPCEEVGKVEEISGSRPALRQMFLQPHQLRYLHFGRYRSAGEIQDRVTRRGEKIRLVDGAMIEPNHRVEPVFAGGRDRHLLAGFAARNQRTCGIKPDGSHTRRIDRRVRHGRPHRKADRLPYVLGIVLGVVFPWPLHQDGMSGARQHCTMTIEHPGARAACSDIDRNEILAHEASFPSLFCRKPGENRSVSSPARQPASALEPWRPFRSRTRWTKSGIASNTRSGSSAAICWRNAGKRA